MTIETKIKNELKKNAKLSVELQEGGLTDEQVKKIDTKILKSWNKLFEMMKEVNEETWNKLAIKAVGTTEAYEYEID